MDETKTRRGSTFTVDDYPCPDCGNFDVLGYLLINQEGHHQHTRYVCTRWNRGAKQPCGWEGWVVPDPDAKIASGDEHPSGLRDAIERGIRDHECRPWNEARVGIFNYIERRVVAWLSVVSEAEIEAAAEAEYIKSVGSYARWQPWPTLHDHQTDFLRGIAAAGLAASRRVLVPRIESDENGGTK